MPDAVDRILAQWHAEKPALDVTPMAVIGRLSRTALAVETRLAGTFALRLRLTLLFPHRCLRRLHCPHRCLWLHKRASKS